MSYRKHIIYHEHESEVLKGNPLGDPHIRTLPVYLPPGYKESNPYPVIWMLAPFTSWGEKLFNLGAWDENIVQRMDRLVASGEAQPAIIAFPDAFTRYGGSQYLNSSATGQYEDYIIKELVPLLDENFRTFSDSNHRAVMGYSSGGYAALVLAMRHPKVFSAAASHSGDMAFGTCYQLDIPGAIRALENAGSIAAFLDDKLPNLRSRNKDDWNALSIIAMSACYSPNPDNDHGFDLPFDTYTGEIIESVWQRWLAVDPLRMTTDHLDTLKNMNALYFDCGNRDEYNLFLGARRLHRLLEQHDIAHRYEEFDGGHGGINWRYDFSLPALTHAISPKV